MPGFLFLWSLGQASSRGPTSSDTLYQARNKGFLRGSLSDPGILYGGEVNQSENYQRHYPSGAPPFWSETYNFGGINVPPSRRK